MLTTIESLHILIEPMEDANKFVIPKSVMEYFRKTGAIGGRSRSAKKLAALAINRAKPCAPGKRRGRPKGSKNKKK